MIGNKSFENVVKFNNFGKIITNQNFIHQEIKSRLNSGNSYYNSVQYFVFSSLLQKLKD